MPLQLQAATFEAQRPAQLAQFWARVLNRDIVEDTYGMLLPGDGTQLGIRFTLGGPDQVDPHRMHLHLTSATAHDQEQTVAAALELGAAHIDIGQQSEEGHVVLADPGGNAFCVIEPGNSFLAGCGFLGELACEGTRDVGVFWSKALSWPLVWDQEQETAVQTRQGGTKVAWGGPPVAPQGARSRQRFHLVAVEPDHETEIGRLLALGATRVLGESSNTLLDPDGNEFCVEGLGG